VDLGTTETFIKYVFDTLNWGEIAKIDIIPERCVANCKVFIHFSSMWNKGVFAHLTNEREIKVSHQYGFWNVRKSRWESFQSSRKTKKADTIGYGASKFAALFVEDSEYMSSVPVHPGESIMNCPACEELERGAGGENQMAHMMPGGCLDTSSIGEWGDV